jgi:hypothetical protein
LWRDYFGYAFVKISTHARSGMKKGLFILASVSNSYPPPPDYDATRGTPCSHKAGNRIETHKHKGDSVQLESVSASPALFSTSLASGIIKDFVFRQLKEMSAEVKEEIELKIAQSLPRSRLNKLAA